MKTFLSIGTGPGIGLATAERFSSAGFHTVLGSRHPASLEPYVQGLGRSGGSSEAREVDAGDPAQVRALVADVLGRHGSIDVLHYNAASLRQASVVGQPTDSFLPDLAVNIGGALVAIQAVYPSMQARGQGAVLLTGGRFGVTPVPQYLSLSVGKAGIRALALGLFETFKAEGIHIATVTVSSSTGPGAAWSQGVAEAFWSLYHSPKESWVAEARYPEGPSWG